MKNFYKEKKLFLETNKKFTRRIILISIISLIFIIILFTFSPSDINSLDKKIKKSSMTMDKAIDIISKYRATNIIGVNQNLDPNKTGLIGPENSPIITTLGNLQAKRTTTNPNMAALVAYLLKTAGVKKGDTVAVGSSGSFPALMIASVSAIQNIKAKPVVILSLGSSSYGAGNIEFNLLKIYEILYENGIFKFKPAGVSLGGEKDIGNDFTPEAKIFLKNYIKKKKYNYIYESDLRKNVKQRLKIYKKNSTDKKIKAFINCGGSYVSLGTSSLVLKVKPGLNFKSTLPSKNRRGMIFEMISRNIPCIHLLFIKGLIQKHNLPWDPIPLPEAGNHNLFKVSKKKKAFFIPVSFLYLLIILILIIVWFYKDKSNIINN